MIEDHDNWVPACAGTEKPTLYRSGHILLYVWNQATGRHAWLDTASDLILDDDEAMRLMA